MQKHGKGWRGSGWQRGNERWHVELQHGDGRQHSSGSVMAVAGSMDMGGEREVAGGIVLLVNKGGMERDEV